MGRMGCVLVIYVCNALTGSICGSTAGGKWAVNPARSVSCLMPWNEISQLPSLLKTTISVLKIRPVWDIVTVSKHTDRGAISEGLNIKHNDNKTSVFKRKRAISNIKLSGHDLNRFTKGVMGITSDFNLTLRVPDFTKADWSKDRSGDLVTSWRPVTW